jgi:glycosyltransferase involved in cell wall biosynthesis
MTAPEQVALVVPCHNYGRYAAESLASVAAQTVSPAEVVVVDDGSTDDSAAVLEVACRDLASSMSVQLVTQSHQGLAAAVATGLARTASPLFAVVSADDRLLPGFVSSLSRALHDRPDAAFAYPKMRLFGDESGIYKTYAFDVDRLLFDQNYVPGIAMMRRDAYADVGGLRDLVAFEDWDLFLALAERGWSGVLVPEVLYEWRRHSVARSRRSVSSRLALRGRILAGHHRLLVRRAHMAVPWTAYSVGRRAGARFGGKGASRRSQSAWVEVDAS